MTFEQHQHLVVQVMMILAKFLNDEKIYLTEICKISVGESISFDHTFKVAANIGFLHDDGVWVCNMIVSLLC